MSASFGLRGWSGWKPSRSIANVGLVGSGVSKKWTGKLLAIPPSENQQTSATQRVRRRAAVLHRVDSLARALPRHVERAQRDGADQEREAQAHPGCDDDGQVVRRGEGAQRCKRVEASSRPLPVAAGAGRRRVRLHPGDDPLGKEPTQLRRIEEELATRPRHPVRAPVRDVRRHHLELDAPGAEVAEGERAAVVLAREVVDQVGEPGRQGRRPLPSRREAGAEAEAVLAESLRQPEPDAQAERHRQAEEREDDAGDHRADGERAGARPERKDGERDPRRRPGGGRQGEAPERCGRDAQPSPATLPSEPRCKEAEVRPCATLGLEEAEQVVAAADPRGELRELLEPAVLATVLRRGRAGGGDRAGRRPADVREPVGARELAQCVRVDDTARDAALQHHVARPRGMRVVVRPRIAGGHGEAKRSSAASGCLNGGIT